MPISFQNNVNEDTFIEVQLRAETAHLFGSLRETPGVTASATWNMIFSEMTSPDGNRICFFAGPGITAGVADDIPYHMVHRTCPFHTERRFFTKECGLLWGHIVLSDNGPVAKPRLVLLCRDGFLHLEYI